MSDDENAKKAGADASENKREVKILHVETRFSTMANRKGGISRKDAVKRAETFVEHAGGEYPSWLDRDMKLLIEAFEHVHAAKGFTPATHDATYRCAGQIRDLGGTFGYPLTTSVGDSLCELIFRLAEAKLYSREALEAHTNALKLVCTPNFKGVPASAVGELMDSLEKLVSTYPDPDADLKEIAQADRARLRKPKTPG